MIALAIPRPELGTRAEARTKEVERALAMDADYVLFLDLDQTMPDSALAAMMALEVDMAIVDTPPHDSNLANVTYNPDGSICYCTMACSLIRTSVFRSLPKPWFSSGYDFIKAGVAAGKYTLARLDKSVDNNIGEDVYFIRKAIEGGFSLGIVPEIRCNHYRL